MARMGLCLFLVLTGIPAAGEPVHTCGREQVERVSAELHDTARVFDEHPEASARAVLALLPNTFECHEAVFGHPNGPLYSGINMFSLYSTKSRRWRRATGTSGR
jgi:hypothetical protein